MKFGMQIHIDKTNQWNSTYAKVHDPYKRIDLAPRL